MVYRCLCQTGGWWYSVTPISAADAHRSELPPKGWRGAQLITFISILSFFLTHGRPCRPRAAGAPLTPEDASPKPERASHLPSPTLPELPAPTRPQTNVPGLLQGAGWLVCDLPPDSIVKGYALFLNTFSLFFSDQALWGWMLLWYLDTWISHHCLYYEHISESRVSGSKKAVSVFIWIINMSVSIHLTGP